MSYLLDALRKAERERHRERGPDLADIHEPLAETGRQRLPAWVAPLVAVLVLTNLGVVGAFWLLRDGNPQPPAAPASPETGTAAAAAPPAKPAPPPEPRAATAASPAPAQPRPAPSAETTTRPQAAPAPARREEPATWAESESGFDGEDSYREPADSVAALPADVRRQLPGIEVNGHLYSSVPGRSFILINGRRYREGERLREGPAIVTIDEGGAILDYRGERFRVSAPR
ncbi:hypothetical protein PC39_15814 [Salinisphaera sp. PC39]|uniref:general secretion pathway protein GspB n=1 Tax=Salinisphaera sp. PC39 TaxID=1304156 RepID=UPI003342210B